MSNKTQLQTNNTNLDILITRVNAAKDTAASLPEAGGGESGGNGAKIFFTSFQPSENTNTISIPHSLGVVPTHYWITLDYNGTKTPATMRNQYACITCCGTNDGKSFLTRYSTSSASNIVQGAQTGTSYAINGSNVIADADSFTITLLDSNYFFYMNITYSIILVAD